MEKELRELFCVKIGLENALFKKANAKAKCRSIV